VMLSAGYTQTICQELLDPEDIDTHALLRTALAMLDAPTRPAAGPPGTGVYSFDPTQRTHKYTGRKPRWDATREHQCTLKGMVPPIGEEALDCHLLSACLLPVPHLYTVTKMFCL
jgi:hypothetical protein